MRTAILVASFLLLVFSLSMAGQLAPITPLQPVKNIPCPAGKACETFKQMVKGKDEDVLSANWACFYTSKTPSEIRTTFKEFYHGPDEFFLLMDGKASKMRSGLHPGIFVNRVMNALPQGYSGYGPQHGGLDEARQDQKFNSDHDVTVRTYDDLGPEFRFISFGYVSQQQACWARVPIRLEGRTQKEEEEYKKCSSLSSEYDTLGAYEETRIRKSSGRFEHRWVNLTDAEDSNIYAGQCLRLK